MTFWTDSKSEELKSKWINGMACFQLAQELGCTLGMISGKLNRMGLKRSEEDAQERRSKRQKRADPKPRPERKTRFYAPPTQPEAVPEPVDPPIPFDGKGVTLFELEPWSCCWPIGDPGHPDFSFCGAMSIEGFPYCRSHGRIAYRPQERRRA